VQWGFVDYYSTAAVLEITSIIPRLLIPDKKLFIEQSLYIYTSERICNNGRFKMWFVCACVWPSYIQQSNCWHSHEEEARQQWTKWSFVSSVILNMSFHNGRFCHKTLVYLSTNHTANFIPHCNWLHYCM